MTNVKGFTIVVLAISIYSVASQEAYQQTALDLHNQYRAKHGALPLTLDPKLNELAMTCALYYANQGANDHTCPEAQAYGENLIGGEGVWSQDQFGKDAPTSWYDEVSKYDYDQPGFSMDTGHFTQLVWKSSKRLGFAVTTSNGFTSGVGLYDPPGNYDGQFPENVLRPQ